MNVLIQKEGFPSLVMENLSAGFFPLFSSCMFSLSGYPSTPLYQRNRRDSCQWKGTRVYLRNGLHFLLLSIRSSPVQHLKKIWCLGPHACMNVGLWERHEQEWSIHICHLSLFVPCILLNTGFGYSDANADSLMSDHETFNIHSQLFAVWAAETCKQDKG